MLAKTEERENARKLRLGGMSVPNIALSLGISKSSASIYVRDCPIPEEFTPEYRAKLRAIRKADLLLQREAQKQARQKNRIGKLLSQVDEYQKDLPVKIRPVIKNRRHYEMVSINGKLLSGDGRWMIPAPSGYQGRKYIKGLYVYEHRYLMEQKLGRLLSYNEVVHHINRNKLDNRIENLELRTRASHTKEHSIPVAMATLKCFLCGIGFEREQRIYNEELKRGQKRFFCCRSHQVSVQQKERHSCRDSSVGRTPES